MPIQPTVPMWQYPHYADAGYAIIGRALESVVGMSWEDWVTQHIFKPLGTLLRSNHRSLTPFASRCASCVVLIT
jgi:CubicO group peptidase (beta-lactamase class C family)